MQKVLIVTGASRGIGAAIARLAAADGYAVCVNYLNNQDAAAAVVASMTRTGAIATAFRADVAVEQEVRSR
jgi:NAD(P)-dependent dehydrogenase (short-subunit alcohol dehydrogenase family)